MNPQQPAEPLLVTTGQRSKLARAGYTFFAGLAALCVAKWGLSSLDRAAFLLVAVFACAVMSVAIAYAFIAVRCPKCKLAWVRWSVSHQPYTQWLHWLYQFTACPGCAYTVSPGSSGHEQPNPSIERTA